MMGLWRRRCISPQAWARTLTAGGVIAMAALGGCTSLLIAASGFLTEEKAVAYAPLPPFEFVKQRFFDEEQSSTFAAIDKGILATKKVLEAAGVRADYVKPPGPELNAGAALVTWPAYYTDQNYVQLLRPMADLRLYCLARKGVWKTVEPYAGDPVAMLRANPLLAFVDAHSRVMRNLQANGAYIGFEELREVIASDVGAEMAAEAAVHNVNMQQSFSVVGLEYAKRLKAFGLFACEQPGTQSWLVSVLPVTLIGMDLSNQSRSTTARLVIRVYEAGQPRGVDARAGKG